MNAEVQDKCLRRMVDKIKNNAERIIHLEESETEDAEVVVVSYGITSRVAVKAIQMAKADGIKVGHLRLITAWPFPEERIRTLASRVKAFVFPELNLGQMFLEMQRVIEGTAACHQLPHAGGTVHDPEVIYQKIVYAAKQLHEKKGMR